MEVLGFFEEGAGNMRLVDADAIQYKRDIAVTERFPKFGGFNGKIVYSVTKEEIDAMPTVDAVPVVRCRDCKHYQFADDRAFGFPVKRCEVTGFGDVDDYDYCSRGEQEER